ncbi:nucleotidyltransferase family protein [Flavihumibacter fluvii]|uniref:nucleotidyltransferase family protein n=1 Tax=Flavihumibacter fluvii TaxID=2838157 RepID=UPI001BDE7CD3|nr:sugar phosphate nucleotidyltransferase [Flavihumibacter fluvii]ULQ52378.1 NTP transferase domain-containing protein [Flavihumibacter fluvii]
MKAMIFAAGLGTRFKPWTDLHPKALALVNGKSLLQRNIEYLQRFGINEVVVNVHHFADQIYAAVAENDGWGSTVQFSDETGEVLETGGGLLKARLLLEGYEPFVTINVDILTDLDLSHLFEFHERKEALISFGITNRKTSRNFLFDGDNRLCGWANSQTGEQRISIDKPGLRPMAYSCVAIFEPAVFPLMRPTFASPAFAKATAGGARKFSIVDTYLSLAPAHRIMGFDHSGDRLVDVGKPESVAVAEALFD